MNRGDRMLSVLRDGLWHARADIFQRVGYMLTNNSASELRARGFVVEQRIFQGNYEYRLLDAGPSGELRSSVGNRPCVEEALPSVSSISAAGGPEVPTSLPLPAVEQLTLESTAA